MTVAEWENRLRSDLNLLTTDTADGDVEPPIPSVTVGNDPKLRVHLRDLDYYVESYIERAPLVLGCVAWLTHYGLLDALARTSAAIVVQKEDFLRPDEWPVSSAWKATLRQKYEAIHPRQDRYDFPGLISSLSTSGDPGMEGVRCVGNYNRDKRPAFPRMHHKFLVFCRTEVITEPPMWEGEQPYEHETVIPYAVWTGSFNFTQNAVRSLENAIFTTDPQIVQAYYDEFSHIYSVSEPLDWTSDWSAPDLRIGT